MKCIVPIENANQKYNNQKNHAQNVDIGHNKMEQHYFFPYILHGFIGLNARDRIWRILISIWSWLLVSFHLVQDFEECSPLMNFMEHFINS